MKAKARRAKRVKIPPWKMKRWNKEQDELEKLYKEEHGIDVNLPRAKIRKSEYYNLEGKR